jgi:hypothetical protein
LIELVNFLENCRRQFGAEWDWAPTKITPSSKRTGYPPGSAGRDSEAVEM